MPKQQVLIIGGTNFIGRNLVEQLLQLPQFEVTLFNRGKTNPHLFKNVSTIIGNRKRKVDLESLFTHKWDFVIDTSCYFPQDLEWVLEGLGGNYKNYIFISTCSVYDMEYKAAILKNESALTLNCTKQEELDDTPETYGKRKAACERVLAQNNAPYTCIRPALVYGPYDPTDRLYYWIYQCKKHDAMLLPEGGSRKFSITYVKDLVKLIVASLNEPIESKTYNCISSPIISIKEIVDECVSVFKRSPTLHNVSAAFLKKQGISEWFDMPLWLQNDAFTFSNAAMLNDNGLQPTSLYNGLRETISYYNKKGYSIPSYGIGDNIKLELIKEFLKNE